MYIRVLIPRYFAELAEAVLIEYMYNEENKKEIRSKTIMLCSCHALYTCPTKSMLYSTGQFRNESRLGYKGWEYIIVT